MLVVFPLIGIPMAQIGRRLRKISKGTQEKMADINTLLLGDDLRHQIGQSVRHGTIRKRPF